MPRLEIKGSGNFLIERSVELGSDVEMTVRARVTGIHEDVIDVTDFGSYEPKFTTGETTFTMLILAAEVRNG